MKHTKLYTLITTLLMATTTQVATAEDEKRILIKYKSALTTQTEKNLNDRGAKIHRKLNRHNMISATLKQSQIDSLQLDPNILMTEEDQKRYPLAQSMPYGIDAIQADQVWDSDSNGQLDPGANTGSARTVCVVDSGFYQSHEDLMDVNVVAGKDFTSDNDWTADGCSHGSHVAGTIAATYNSVGVMGVAPETNLVIAKLFDNNCDFTFSSSVIDAVDFCRDQGANIVSMSIGGGFSSFEEAAFADYYNNDNMLSIAAAGNDGNSNYSYPASYDSVVSVAATDAANVVASFSQFNDQVELAGPGVAVLSTVSYAAPSSTLDVAGTGYEAFNIVDAIAGVATGDLVDGGICDSSGFWGGKVVLCERGSIAFSDKVINAANGGAVAAIIYNNLPDAPNFTHSGANTMIPSLAIFQSAGQDLVANSLGESATVSVVVGNIGSSYDLNSGTSMATPHVSGVAALLWNEDPSLTNAEVRQVLQDTALDLGASGRDDFYGHGLVQVKDAIDSLAVGGSPIDLALTVRFPRGVLIEWSGANGELIEGYKDGELKGQFINDGIARDHAGGGVGGVLIEGQTYSYQICEIGGIICSDVETIVFVPQGINASRKFGDVKAEL